MSGKCVVCGKEIPENRKKKDTCSDDCGYTKVAAWANYISRHKAEIMSAAIKELKEQSVAT